MNELLTSPGRSVNLTTTTAAVMPVRPAPTPSRRRMGVRGSLRSRKRGRTRMAEKDIISNQKQILENQTIILDNQQAIKDNQTAIKDNQTAIRSNQKGIKKNQEMLIRCSKTNRPSWRCSKRRIAAASGRARARRVMPSSPAPTQASGAADFHDGRIVHHQLEPAARRRPPRPAIAPGSYGFAGRTLDSRLGHGHVS